MKFQAVVSAVLALSMGTSGLAFAEGPNGTVDLNRATHQDRRAEPQRGQRPDQRPPQRQDRYQGGDRGGPRGMNDSPRENIEARNQQRDFRRDQYNSRRAEEARRDQRRSWEYARDRERARGYDGRGAGPDHRFYRGGYLPPEYRGRQYVVDDWRGHRLSAPPRGYHWVQSGGDYILVAIATGIIASILLNQ
jgi:Ni/Co efflux regulator RcnB